ncbi:protein CREG1 isoform X2 [Eurytemora carolleeae]|uniref:protein CREG1 isoform X2 n=1 Tax=Eurytemora carolleeae TaxID=1294199 RepID=UPI000C785AD3|nr:protein CREG1 isoform X2 [Eurytemora carolleeae]|eukprot:XP_023344801.1 protein CREG1-like isoform X2 [Eurytemora affinis]
MFLKLINLCFLLNMVNGKSTQRTQNIFGNEISDVDKYLTMAESDVMSLISDESDLSILTESEEFPEPPPHTEVSRMSRYLCHHSDWLSMATISTRGPLTGYPFASVFSFSDGTKHKSSGMDMSSKDLEKNPKASVTMSLAQGPFCKKHGLDAEDPRCAHVVMAGEVVQVQPNSTEEIFAKEALFSRHPEMPEWPVDHGWYFAKLNISSIILLDFFGGAIDVDINEYYNTHP